MHRNPAASDTLSAAKAARDLLRHTAGGRAGYFLKQNGHFCSLSGRTFQPDLRVVQLGDMFDNSQSKAGSARLAGPAFVYAVKPLKDTALLGIALIEQSLHHTSEALARLTRLIEQHSDRAELYTIRAEIEAENRQPELAIMDLDKAIELEPGNANTVLTRAYLYKLIGNKRLAHHDFERAIELGVPRSSLKRELKETK